MPSSRSPSLSALVPPSVRERAQGSALLPLELGQLLGAAASVSRSLLAFAPPAGALGATTAGILRAARERSASVILKVDLGGNTGRALTAAFEAVSLAAEAARYHLPMGLLAVVSASGEAIASGRAAADVAEALVAGFPAVFLRSDLLSSAADVADVLSPASGRELGCALQLDLSAVSAEPEPWLRDLRQAGAPVVSIVGDREMALATEAYRWTQAAPQLRSALFEERPPVLEVDLRLPASAREERAEALAYFAAEAALAQWKAAHSGPEVEGALRTQWADAS